MNSLRSFGSAAEHFVEPWKTSSCTIPAAAADPIAALVAAAAADTGLAAAAGHRSFGAVAEVAVVGKRDPRFAPKLRQLH